MSGQFRPAAIAVLALGFAGIASASDQQWVRAFSPDSGYSILTPCDATEVSDFANDRTVANSFAEFDKRSRVVCKKGDWFFVSSVINGFDPRQPKKTIFDKFSSDLVADKSLEGVVTKGTINGRRAFFNREQRDGYFAESGAVEISGAKLVVFIAGARPGSGLSLVEQGEVLDRFHNSIEVASK